MSKNILVLVSLITIGGALASSEQASGQQTMISVSITNNQSSDYNCHVYDRFAGGNREVDGSPFALQKGETNSAPFAINPKGDGSGTIKYSCDGGPSLDNIAVTDGQTVEIR